MTRRFALVPAFSICVGAALFAALYISSRWVGQTLTGGAAFVFASPGRWLALAGTGACLATQPARVVRLAVVAMFGGAALGSLAPSTAVWPWLTSAEIFPAHHVLAPGACLLVGAALLAGERWRSGLLLPAAFASMGALSLTASLNDPAVGSSAFVAGAMLAAFALVPFAAAVRLGVAGRWTLVGERIAGSWLVTIGLLLVALRLAPAPVPMIELAPPATEPVWSAPDVPGFVPPARRDADPLAGGGLPMGTN